MSHSRRNGKVKFLQRRVRAETRSANRARSQMKRFVGHQSGGHRGFCVSGLSARRRMKQRGSRRLRRERGLGGTKEAKEVPGPRSGLLRVATNRAKTCNQDHSRPNHWLSLSSGVGPPNFEEDGVWLVAAVCTRCSSSCCCPWEEWITDGATMTTATGVALCLRELSLVDARAWFGFSPGTGSTVGEDKTVLGVVGEVGLPSLPVWVNNERSYRSL